MSEAQAIPTLQDFLDAPIEQVIEVAPKSVVYAPGGTRRSAVYHQIKPWSHEYALWGWLEMLRCAELIFQHGVDNVFIPLYMSGHVREADGDPTALIQMVKRYLTHPDILAAFNSYGRKVRLIDYDDIPSLAEVGQVFSDTLSPTSPQTLWLTTSISPDSRWNALFAARTVKQVATRADAMLALYGELIPPVSLLLGFGKPNFNPELFPVLLEGEIRGYWSQQVGFGLSAKQLRQVFYDFAYTRETWQKDKTNRAAEAEDDRALWESEFILGLGRRIGPFWYPDVSNYPLETSA